MTLVLVVSCCSCSADAAKRSWLLQDYWGRSMTSPQDEKAREEMAALKSIEAQLGEDEFRATKRAKLAIRAVAELANMLSPEADAERFKIRHYASALGSENGIDRGSEFLLHGLSLCRWQVASLSMEEGVQVIRTILCWERRAHGIFRDPEELLWCRVAAATVLLDCGRAIGWDMPPIEDIESDEFETSIDRVVRSATERCGRL